MQSSSERRGKRKGSILSAAVVLLWLAGLILAVALTALEAARAGECGAAALLLALYGVLGGAAVTFIRDGECFAAILFLLIYGVLGGAVVIGVLLALRQRLKEIKGGEEDDAAQY